MKSTLQEESCLQSKETSPWHFYGGRLVVERSLSLSEACELAKEIINKLDPQGEIE